MSHHRPRPSAFRYDENDKVYSIVEDRRGQRRGGMNLTSLLIIGAVILLFGINPLEVLTGGGGGQFPQIEMPRQQPTQRQSGPNIPWSPGHRQQDDGFQR